VLEVPERRILTAAEILAAPSDGPDPHRAERHARKALALMPTARKVARLAGCRIQPSVVRLAARAVRHPAAFAAPPARRSGARERRPRVRTAARRRRTRAGPDDEPPPAGDPPGPGRVTIAGAVRLIDEGQQLQLPGTDQ
jgi:hypothetical protein